MAVKKAGNDLCAAGALNRRDVLKSLGLGALACSIGAGAGGSAFAAGPVTTTQKPYELPSLPYTYDALAPGIQESVLRIHHTRHHAGYVKGLNATLGKLDGARAGDDFSMIYREDQHCAERGTWERTLALRCC